MLTSTSGPYTSSVVGYFLSSYNTIACVSGTYKTRVSSLISITSSSSLLSNSSSYTRSHVITRKPYHSLRMVSLFFSIVTVQFCPMQLPNLYKSPSFASPLSTYSFLKPRPRGGMVYSHKPHLLIIINVRACLTLILYTKQKLL